MIAKATRPPADPALKLADSIDEITNRAFLTSPVFGAAVSLVRKLRGVEDNGAKLRLAAEVERICEILDDVLANEEKRMGDARKKGVPVYAQVAGIESPPSDKELAKMRRVLQAARANFERSLSRRQGG